MFRKILVIVLRLLVLSFVVWAFSARSSEQNSHRVCFWQHGRAFVFVGGCVYSLVLSLPCDPDIFSVVCLQLNGIGVVAECCSVNNVYVLMSQYVCCRLV